MAPPRRSSRLSASSRLRPPSPPPPNLSDPSDLSEASADEITTPTVRLQAFVYALPYFQHGFSNDYQALSDHVRTDQMLMLKVNVLRNMEKEAREDKWQTAWNNLLDKIGTQQPVPLTSIGPTDGIGAMTGSLDKLHVEITGNNVDLKDLDHWDGPRLSENTLHAYVVGRIRHKRKAEPTETPESLVDTSNNSKRTKTSHRDAGDGLDSPAEGSASMSRRASSTLSTGNRSGSGAALHADVERVAGSEIVGTTATEAELAKMGLRLPDFSVCAEVRLGRPKRLNGRIWTNSKCASVVGELKPVSDSATEAHTDIQRERGIVRCCLAKALVYLSIACDISGTRMGFAVVGSQFARLIALDKSSIIVEVAESYAAPASDNRTAISAAKWLSDNHVDFKQCLPHNVCSPTFEKSQDDKEGALALARLFTFLRLGVEVLCHGNETHYRLTDDHPCKAIWNRLLTTYQNDFKHHAELSLDDDDSRQTLYKHARKEYQATEGNKRGAESRKKADGSQRDDGNDGDDDDNGNEPTGGNGDEEGNDGKDGNDGNDGEDGNDGNDGNDHGDGNDDNGDIDGNDGAARYGHTKDRDSYGKQRDDGGAGGGPQAGHDGNKARDAGEMFLDRKFDFADLVVMVTGQQGLQAEHSLPVVPAQLSPAHQDDEANHLALTEAVGEEQMRSAVSNQVLGATAMAELEERVSVWQGKTKHDGTSGSARDVHSSCAHVPALDLQNDSEINVAAASAGPDDFVNRKDGADVGPDANMDDVSPAVSVCSSQDIPDPLSFELDVYLGALARSGMRIIPVAPTEMDRALRIIGENARELSGHAEVAVSEDEVDALTDASNGMDSSQQVFVHQDWAERRKRATPVMETVDPARRKGRKAVV